MTDPIERLLADTLDREQVLGGREWTCSHDPLSKLGTYTGQALQLLDGRGVDRDRLLEFAQHLVGHPSPTAVFPTLRNRVRTQATSVELVAAQDWLGALGHPGTTQRTRVGWYFRIAAKPTIYDDRA